MRRTTSGSVSVGSMMSEMERCEEMEETQQKGTSSPRRKETSEGHHRQQQSVTPPPRGGVVVKVEDELIKDVFRSTGRMQHLLGITTVWVLLPATTHAVRFRHHMTAPLVLLHAGVTLVSVLYWRHYDQDSVSGHLDKAGSVLAMAALVITAGRDAWLQAGFLITAIAGFYQLSVCLRARGSQGPGLVAHVSFRFCAFWLSVLVLVGRGSISCAFCDALPFSQVVALTLAYASHCCFEFFVGAAYVDDLYGVTPVLPWSQYSKGLARTAALVVFSGLASGLACRQGPQRIFFALNCA